MKKVLIGFVMSLVMLSCTNNSRVSQEEQDSSAAATTADSMLNDAIKSDTTAVDKLAIDTSGTDSL
ncbi:MAG TPA: hypothetical protein VNI52_09385 [Sphingobacteriaceae bacterium]|nr:hypothetical protein [Sphingobacteriaceae bacterium]